MLKDITLGQYFPGNSVIHRIDPRIKVVLTVAFVVAVFLVQGFAGYGILAAFLVLAGGLSRIKPGYLLKSLKPLLFIILFTFVLNLFFTKGETVLFSWWIFTLTEEGLLSAVYMAIRLVFLVMGTSLLTLTTSPLQLTDALERLFAPLKVLRFPVHELAMMMSIALRFIPTLLEETQKIQKAQMARGADFESGNLMARAKAMVPLLVPLFVSAFRRADELAMAMEARCYRGGDGRTRMKVLKLGWIDLFASLVLAGTIALILLLERWL